jgi:hypothetical protein
MRFRYNRGMSDRPLDSRPLEPSDGPKKKSRVWGWWLAGILLVVYPLSIGPAFWVCQVAGPEDRVTKAIYFVVYAPMLMVCSRVRPLKNLATWYVSLWKPAK